MYDYVKDPVVHVRVHYGNKNNQHALVPPKWNVAAQLAEELKTVTDDTPPLEEHRKRKRKKRKLTKTVNFSVLTSR